MTINKMKRCDGDTHEELLSSNRGAIKDSLRCFAQMSMSDVLE